MKRLRGFLSLFGASFSSWNEDKAPRLGAALAYYTVFSIPPLLILLIGIAGLAFGREAVQGRIVDSLGRLVGGEGARAIEDMLASVQTERRGVLASVLGMATLLLGASGVFAQLKDALNTVWEIEPRPGKGLLSFVRKYFFSIMVLLGTGFLLLVSLALSAMLSAVGDQLGRVLPGGEGLWRVVDVAFTLVVVVLLFALMFKFIPDAKVAWRDALVGGALTSVLFTIGETLIGLYLGRSNVGSAFGAAGSLVVLLVWVYYSSMILLFGAEFTRAWARRFGSDIEPDEDAMRLVERERLQQGMAPSTRASA